MEALGALGIAPNDIGVARRNWIQPAGANVAPESVLMWADVLGAARMESRVVGRYVGLMFVAGIIAGYGVIIDNPILIVGAMAVSPDLVPLIAASVGLVTGRWSLIRRGAATLIVGLGMATAAAFGVVELLDLARDPAEHRPGSRPDGVLQRGQCRNDRRCPRRRGRRRPRLREPGRRRRWRGDLRHDDPGGRHGRGVGRSRGMVTNVGRPRSLGRERPLPDCCRAPQRSSFSATSSAGGSARISRYPARRSHVRPQQVVPDQAAEGRQRRKARGALHEADPRDHHRRPPGRRRSGRELPAADGRRQGPRQLDAGRQHQARDRASLRRWSRRRAVRGDHLRRDRSRQRRGHRRGDDRQPQPHGVRGAQHLHSARRDAVDRRLAVRTARGHQHPA